MRMMRLMSNFVKQFNNPKSNLVYYYCSTKFNKYVSFNNFMGNNENTYFTNGAKNILILENLMPNSSLNVRVYNVDSEEK